jgi:hypothetical protein
MSFRGTSFLAGGFLVSVIVSSVYLMPGCGGGNETGTMVTRPKEADEGERKSMDGMKAMMKKARPKTIQDPSKRH